MGQFSGLIVIKGWVYHMCDNNYHTLDVQGCQEQP